MKILKQGDLLWGDTTIGSTTLKLKDFGCTITSLSMLSDYFTKFGGIFIDPGQLAKKLKFTANGLIIWSSVRSPTINFNFEWRQYGHDQKRIDASLKDPKKAVILEVALGKGKHWVVALRRIPLTNTYWIADPLTGKKGLSSSYGKITGSSHITI